MMMIEVGLFFPIISLKLLDDMIGKNQQEYPSIVSQTACDSSSRVSLSLERRYTGNLLDCRTRCLRSLNL